MPVCRLSGATLHSPSGQFQREDPSTALFSFPLQACSCFSSPIHNNILKITMFSPPSQNESIAPKVPRRRMAPRLERKSAGHLPSRSVKRSDPTQPHAVSQGQPIPSHRLGSDLGPLGFRGSLNATSFTSWLSREVTSPGSPSSLLQRRERPLLGLHGACIITIPVSLQCLP